MRATLFALLASAALGLSSAAYAADPPAAPAGATSSPATMGPAMMGGGMMNMGAMRGQCMSDERLTALKTELKLTDAQLPLWNAFVDAVKASAQAMRQSMGIMQGAQSGSGMMGMASTTLPERLERGEAMMTAHLDALRKVRAAVSPLYDALTPDQKAKIDRLMCAPMSGQVRASAGSRHAHAHHPQ